ncbi:MAG: hypothetical protein COV75_05355 [Candidatus Omnitrophica bacterium CG11_big_fil_rev_8_21_14_0_20_63_9]|nr:MAG: hypothetical protein COV75_05355 [Candidatus Omnitrophica bacterium CG11_big_fil_rev_8_21_14_0_20_63_9]
MTRRHIRPPGDRPHLFTLLGPLALVSLAIGGCSFRQIARSWRPLPPSASTTTLVLWFEPFETLDPERWRHTEVKGRTQYDIVTLDERRCLKAESRDGASILLAAADFDPDKFEWLSWSWRVDQLVEGEALDRKQGSDAAARVYVYFETPGLPWQKRNIDYVWSATLPVGTILQSAFAASSKMIVVESGTSALGQWRRVERNLEEDYRRCFGKYDPPNVIAIGLMTDTDNTHSVAIAYFDDLRISRRPGDDDEPPPQ